MGHCSLSWPRVNLATFCLCLEYLHGFKLKKNGLIYLAGGFSRQDRIRPCHCDGLPSLPRSIVRQSKMKSKKLKDMPFLGTEGAKEQAALELKKQL